ncbi:SpoIIE family protein phosphatase [Streptomyces sp. NPDC018610]|uniref:SpoIIE family protein phosphatase n=1 Tax=Streptomyces sp. NPDC018610 TaxID=3365049 RepID=UPI0037B1082C
MPRVWDVPVHETARAHDARVAAEDAAATAGLDERRADAAALVASELATNLLKHTRGGRILVEVVPPPVAREGGQRGPVVQILAVDDGPGMADVSAALRDGYSTARSLGAGLGTCLRLADEFRLHSTPGRGTVALARIGAAARTDGPATESETHASGNTGPGTETGGHATEGTGHGAAGAVRAGGVGIPRTGEDHSGDAWGWVRSGDRLTLMLADGLGHGPEAARASSAAVEALDRLAHLAPAELLRRLDTVLRGTRGAAVAVAQLDVRAGLLRFAGVGDVGARLREGDHWRPLPSRPGVVGGHRPATPPGTEAAWAPDRMLVLHSGGLPSRWTPPAEPGLPTADPAVTAAVTVRDACGTDRPVRDDTTVIVLAPTLPERP